MCLGKTEQDDRVAIAEALREAKASRCSVSVTVLFYGGVAGHVRRC